MNHLNPAFRLLSSACISALILTSPLANSWTDDVEALPNINTLCKPEPEAQCTQAVRIGLEAPGVDWRESSMAQIRLDDANLQGANLSRSIMHLSNLSGANLMLANLQGTHLHAANMRGTNLTMANLEGARLLDADLSGANLLGARLEKTILIQAQFGGATWPDGRVCAQGSVGECL